MRTAVLQLVPTGSCEHGHKSLRFRVVVVLLAQTSNEGWGWIQIRRATSEVQIGSIKLKCFLSDKVAHC